MEMTGRGPCTLILLPCNLLYWINNPSAVRSSAGIPRNSVTLGRPGTPGGNAGLAEAGSLQLEWLTLSARTKNQIYRQKALRVFDSIHKANPDQVQQVLTGQSTRDSFNMSMRTYCHNICPCRQRPRDHGWQLLASNWVCFNEEVGLACYSPNECSSWQQVFSACCRPGATVMRGRPALLKHCLLPQGLIPTNLRRDTATGEPYYSMGAAADSYYEYLIKVWLASNKKVRCSAFCQHLQWCT